MTSEILGVAIGVVFIFMLFSLFLSTTLEAISAFAKLRGRALRVALARLVDDPQRPVRQGGFGFVDAAIFWWAERGTARACGSTEQATGPIVADDVDWTSPERHEPVLADGDAWPVQPIRFADVFSHPLVAGSTGKGNPSYVPDANFTSALLHTLLQDRPEASIAALTERVSLLPQGPVRQALEGALLDAQGDWTRLRAGIDRWYSNAMDRLSGEYKRFSQLITFLIGLLLAIVFNIDSVSLAQQLYTDPILRKALTEQAAQWTAQEAAKVPVKADAKADGKLGEKAKGEIGAMDEVIDKWIKQRDQLTRIVPGATLAPSWRDWEQARHSGLGWFVTALAGMLGAPFWFDLLMKLSNLRGTGPKPPAAADKKEAAA